ncbi:MULTISPECIES: aldehyde dehydrogenase family protein [unclassified Novosphingobium]|uniref:aldehyde dehydrogenase family protein n=1 Tax=unclassified Novosphingobium TaxID=2644732 RepID=UPI00182D0C6A|nr:MULTISPECIES: aldehyde dehydrogenase family protein [unclassified Novosphingobium]NMN04664.1 acyl-CoA reductase-like NAD-dependent aldehyde dehydrogenase [Novosphingobium sp. SG919]NMN85343.1 acyl-CoA reductase-like NAD-dependent aldehyde dehydrogenase [Novosphingobium sp. SG916]
MPHAPVLPHLRHPHHLFIDGAWREPSGREQTHVVSPTTGAVIATLASGDADDIAAAVDAARAAFDHGPWPHLSPAERAAYLRRMGDLLRARIPDLANAWIEQIGALAGVAPLVVGGGVAWFDSYADLADRYAWSETRALADAPGTALVVREPVGVVAAIAPWNNPFGIMAGKIAPALLAGCTLVMKPAPETPIEAWIIAEAAQDAGLPPGVLNLVVADRAASDGLVRHPGIDKVSFTGSVAAGTHIAAVCGARMARCTTELGGKSAAIVLDDFPIETAARTLARTITMSAGQICAVLSRAIVPEAHRAAFVAAAADEMRRVRIGHPRDAAAEMGPLAMVRQRERVEAFVAQAIAEGATLATGGARPAHLPDGAYYEPTLLTDVGPANIAAREEIFGPVLTVLGYDTLDQAIALANATPYGIYGTVFTHDPAAFSRVARGVRSGTLTQNAFRFDSALPFGGFKLSGCGREGGKEGLDSFTEYKAVIPAAAAPAGHSVL